MGSCFSFGGANNGQRGRRGMNGMFDAYDSDMFGRGRRGGMNGIFCGDDDDMSGEQQRKLPPLVVEVPCTLEQLNRCVMRKLKVRRNMNESDDEKNLVLELNPWWKDGTKVTFDGEGDQKPGYLPQDVQFIIRESKHNVFKRKGDDLISNVALTGCVINQRGVDCENVRLEVSDVIRPNEENKERRQR